MILNFTKLVLVYSLPIFVKRISSQNIDYASEDKLIGTCSDFHHIACYMDKNCPGYCDEKSDNAGSDCSKKLDCKGGKCIHDTCVTPTGTCEDDESRVCKKKSDCGTCSKYALNPGSDCYQHKDCGGKLGRCLLKQECIFPTGFCEGDGKEVCETKYDCPGSCSENSRNAGQSCVKNNQCKGKGGMCLFERCIIEKLSSIPSDAPISQPTFPPTQSPIDSPTATSTYSPTDAPISQPTFPPTQSPTDTPTAPPTNSPTDVPTSQPTFPPTQFPTITPTAPPTNSPTDVPTSQPTFPPTQSPTDSPTAPPTSSPTEPPTSQPTLPPSLEEILLSDDLFGPSSTTCSNYIPEDGEYSFTFDLSSLPYFDNSLSEVEKVMFQVQMSHKGANSDRNWSIKLGKGGHIYSFKGPYGESIPPNTKSGMQFVDEVNQKVCVDTAKNNDPSGGGYFVHQSGVYQNGDAGYTNTMPFWFSPNVAIYCSTIIPECRMASWGQQSYPRSWTERIIYYDRYRDCGDGILERTHLIHNAEIESTDTVLTFTNMPWGGTRYSTLKDFAFSQNPNTWNFWEYNLPGGIEDPMLIFGGDSSYGLKRTVPVTWTLGYTVFAQDLPFSQYPTFNFPGRLPASADQPMLVANYGSNTNWICQGPLNGYDNPNTNNYRCRFHKDYAVQINSGCFQCDLKLTNSNGQSISIYNVRNWLLWTASFDVYMMYFNSEQSIDTIRSVITAGANLTVTWDEVGKDPEDNLALSFVHGLSEQMVGDNYNPSKIRYGYANNVERDFAVFEYISYPNLAFGESFRARQYYITDRYTGLESRSKALAADTIEEVIPSGQFETSVIRLHYVNNGQSTKFGFTVGNDPCNNIEATTVACTGSSTPQLFKKAFMQINCGTSTYVGTDFYHFSNYPEKPYRVMNCKVDGVTTSERPTIKLLGYFDEVDCGTKLQDKIFDATFCHS